MSYWKSPPGYLGTSSLTSYYNPSPHNWGLQPPDKTCIANYGQTVPDTVVVVVDPWRNTSPKMGYGS